MISMREIVNNRSGSEARLVWLVGSTRTLTLADQGWRCGLTPVTSISPSRPINIKRGSVQIAREKYKTNPITRLLNLTQVTFFEQQKTSGKVTKGTSLSALTLHTENGWQQFGVSAARRRKPSKGRELWFRIPQNGNQMRMQA